MKKAESYTLDLLSSAKTDKNEIPLRTVVCENSLYRVNPKTAEPPWVFLFFSDPFLMRDFYALVKSLSTENAGSCKKFSMNIEYLYYSFRHEDLLKCANDCIQKGTRCLWMINAAFLSVFPGNSFHVPNVDPVAWIEGVHVHKIRIMYRSSARFSSWWSIPSKYWQALVNLAAGRVSSNFKVNWWAKKVTDTEKKTQGQAQTC